MIDSGPGGLRRMMLDVKTVFVEEILGYRRLLVYLLPTVVTPVMVVMFQIGLILVLANSGDNGMVVLASIIGSFKQSLVTSFGLIVIVGVSGPLAGGLIGRARFSGALEGMLSTPISTTSLWFGKSLAYWLPGALLYLASLSATIIVINTVLGEMGAYTAGEYKASLGFTVLLLVVTLLFTAFLVEVQLGSGPRISVVLMMVQILGVMILLPLLAYRLVRGEPIGSAQILVLEAVAIPAFVILYLLTARHLLDRENITLRFTR